MHAAVAVVGAAHVEVYLQVGKGLQGHLHLQVFGGGGRSGGRYAVVDEQPAALLGLVDIAVAHGGEGKVQSRRECAVPARLAEHVAHSRHEAGQSEVVGVAVADACVAHHHQESGRSLQEGVTLHLFTLGQGHYPQTYLCGVLG